MKTKIGFGVVAIVLLYLIYLFFTSKKVSEYVVDADTSQLFISSCVNVSSAELPGCVDFFNRKGLPALKGQSKWPFTSGPTKDIFISKYKEAKQSVASWNSKLAKDDAKRLVLDDFDFQPWQ